MRPFIGIPPQVKAFVLATGTAPAAGAALLPCGRRRLLARLCAGLLAGLASPVARAAPDALFSGTAGTGVPLGLSLRTDRHVATLIQTREPFLPSLHRDGSQDRFRVSLLLVPLDGSAPTLLRVKGGQPGPAISLAKVLGSDGRRLWFDVAGLGAVDLASGRLVAPAEGAQVDPRTLPRPWGGAPLPPRLEHHLAAGLMASPTTWLGLHAPAELARDFRPGQWLRPVVGAESARVTRHLVRGRLQPDASVGRARIVAMQPMGEASYLNAAFLRPHAKAEPQRLQGPPGVLMLFTARSAAALSGGTTVLARLDEDGRVRWQIDTGIERFGLQQILPGEASTALVGPRPAVPGRLSEPLLVIVDHASGRAATHSLWR